MKTLSTLFLALFMVTGAMAQTESKTETKQKLTPEQRTEKYVAKMQKEVGLDDTQKQKVYDLRLEKVKKIKEIRVANQGDKEKMKTEAKPVVKEYNEALKGILNADQMEKWKVFRKAEREKIKAAAEKRKASDNGKMRENPLEDDDYMDSVDEE